MKKNLPAFLRMFFLACGIMLTGFKASATHVFGVDLRYDWISGNQYRINLVIYGDCSGASFPSLLDATPQIEIDNGNTYYTDITLTLQAPTDGIEVTPVCPSEINMTQCTDVSYTIPGIKKFLYTSIVTLPSAAAYWRFLFTGNMGTGIAMTGRSSLITNIISPGTTVISLVDTLNNTFAHNSSPVLTTLPTPFFCENSSDNYNPGAVDADADSLAFFLVPGIDASVGGDVTYTGAGITATTPLNTAAGAFAFGSFTGQISFTPNAIQRSLVVYNVEEYRNDTFIGTSQREMTFVVLTCTGNPPTGIFNTATNGTIQDSTDFYICANHGAFSIGINPTETDTFNTITVTATGLPAGSSFSTLNNGTNHPNCTFSWTSDGVPGGFYTFYITYTDNNCPLTGSQTLAYTVAVLPIPQTSVTIIKPATCTSKGIISITPGGLGNPWNVQVIQGTDTTRYNSISTTVYDTVAPGTYDIQTFTILSAHCGHDTVITLSPPTPIVITTSFTNPTFCGACDGTLTVSGLTPGDVDTVKYAVDGIAQPPISAIVSGTGTISFINLCGGVFSNITATSGYCASNISGPDTLINPVFSMSYATSINPTTCGYCNGTLTLHGLRPGQVDTINYLFNGVAQTPVAGFVGIDSTITITSLCAGTYSSLIANTASVCISNALGPVVLVDPPLTPNFTDTIRYGCHGDSVLFTNLSTPVAGLYYHWYFGDGYTDTATNPMHIYTTQGAFAVKLVITNLRCVDSITIPVNLLNAIHASFTVTPNPVCQGNVATFTNTSVGTLPSYVWYFGDGTTDSNTNTSHTYPVSGIYTAQLVAADFVPCKDTATQLIYVDSISTLAMTLSDSVICVGQDILFTGIYTNIGSAGVVWNFGDEDSIRNVNPVVHGFAEPGTFTVTIDALFRACPDVALSKTVVIIPYPHINLGPDTSICPGSDPITLIDNINTPSSGARWLWSTGDVTPSIQVTQPGNYFTTVTVNGCSVSDTVLVANDCYMDIPNVFTPNGDGVNDYFFPRNYLSRGLTTFSMNIYNRWGQLIFSTTSIEGRGWDGRFNNVAQPEGVFVYLIDAAFKDGQKEHHQGNITLLR